MSLLDLIESISGDPELSIDPFSGNIIRKGEFKFRNAAPFNPGMMREILDLYLNRQFYPPRYFEILNFKNAEALRTAICRTYKKVYGHRLPAELMIGALYKEEVINSRKETCLETYGCEWASQSPEVRAKVEATCIERYGAVCFLATAEGRERALRTIMERYGVDNVFKSPLIQQKIRETLMERYGVDNPLKSPEILAKVRATCLERYGVENAGCLQSLTGIGDLDDNIAIWRYNERKRLENDPKALKSFIMANFGESGVNFYLKRYGFRGDRGPSRPEDIMSELLESLGIGYTADNRPEFMRHPDTGAKRELDFILKDYNIAIEVNGMFTHDSNNGCGKDYHRFKFERCEENGLKLLMFTENEIYNDIQFVKEIILYHLGLQKKLDIPRECKVRFGFKSIFKSKKDELFQFGNFNHWYPV